MQAVETLTSRKAMEGPIHEILARRYSPRAFSPRPVEAEKLARLFEAARSAPSSYNAQPWSFILATRDDAEGFNRLLSTLVDVNRQWAQQAPVLILAVAKLDFDHVARRNHHSHYDLGQAVATLTVEATSLDLYLHQMGGYDGRLARELFAIPAGYEPVAVLALGYQAAEDGQPERTRKPLADFVFSGSWGRPASIALEASQ